MIYEVPKDKLIQETAKKLEKELEAPSWSEFVKTGVHKQRPPSQPNWWHLRAASILNKIEALGPIGVSKLAVKYGGRKNRGVKPEQFRKGSGKIIRTVLQQLEKAELIKQGSKGVHKGRVITPKGLSLLHSTAKSIKSVKK